MRGGNPCSWPRQRRNCRRMLKVSTSDLSWCAPASTTDTTSWQSAWIKGISSLKQAANIGPVQPDLEEKALIVDRRVNDNDA